MRVVLCLLLMGYSFAVEAFASGSAAVELTTAAPLAPDIEALPRVTSGISPDKMRDINNVLARLDAAARDEAQECIDGKSGDMTRSVETTMNGPRFLSFYAQESFFCAGAAHPDTNSQALVFDLESGSVVDWEALLPGKVRRRRFDADLEQKFPYHGIVTSDALWMLYKAAALKENGKDCAHAFEEQLDFILSLSAERGAVSVDEVALRHADKACGATLHLSTEMLKHLGAKQVLIDSLSHARSPKRRPGSR